LTWPGQFRAVPLSDENEAMACLGIPFFPGGKVLFHRQAIFVKERVGFLKLTDVYDLLDPENGAVLGQVRDEPSSGFKYLRLVVKKIMLPTTFNVYEGSNPQPSLSLVKKAQFFRAHLQILSQGQPLLNLRGKLFSLRGYYEVLDPASGREIAQVRGDWKGWNFQLLDPNGQAVGTITKKWAGIGKELFTSADNYIVALGPAAGSFPKAMESLLAISIAIDAVHKEQQ
jgi:uncharacterized protein YxjI